jgi:hypothetical protein
MHERSNSELDITFGMTPAQAEKNALDRMISERRKEKYEHSIQSLVNMVHEEAYPKMGFLPPSKDPWNRVTQH